MATADPFLLSPCTPTDIPGMKAVYLSAFASDPFTALTFPPSTVTPLEMDRWLSTRFATLMAKREIHSFKIVDTTTNTICAFLRCTFPHVLSEEEKVEGEVKKTEREEERKKGRDPMWPVGADLRVCDGKFGALDGLRGKYVVDEEMYVAHLLATNPVYQRKGLASKLLRRVLDMADAEGRKCYIEATAAGYPVYCKLGFEEVDAVEVDLRQWGGEGKGINRVMIREPVGKV